MKQALIVTGGRIEPEFFGEYIRQQRVELVVAVDSGMRFFYEAKTNPDWIVGDFDSVEPAVLQYFEQQKGIDWIRLIPEKDDTDTEAALRRVIGAGYQQIHILGGTGSRLDHVLGNIQLLGIGLEQGVEILLVDSHNRIRMIDTELKIARAEQFGYFISLIPFTPKVTGLTLKGMKYPLTKYTMVCYNSLGVSNEIIEHEASISLDTGVLLVLETRD